MAEYLFKDLLNEKGKADEYYVCSSATSNEEEGNPVHRGTASILDRLGIDYSRKRAVRIKKEDYDKFDLFIGMDEENVKTLKRLFGGDGKNKVKLLLSYVGENRGVADPWYTHDFATTFADVQRGIVGLYGFLENTTGKKGNVD